MKIFVFGNINSGKSCVVKTLEKIFGDFEVFQIDEYRKKYGDGSIEKENEAQEKFSNDVCSAKNEIVEFTGLGKIAELITASLSGKESIVIVVKEKSDVCIDRLKIKNFSSVPYPKYQNMENLEQTIFRLDKEISSGEIEKIWRNKIFRFFYIEDIAVFNSLPLSQYKRIFDLKNILTACAEALFLFGSLARSEGDNLSDADLFLLTKKNTDKIFALLKSRFDSIDRIENKIIISDCGIDSEIYVIDDINQCKKFYQGSFIKDAQTTILIGDDNLREILQKIISEYKFEVEAEIKNIKAKLNYYCHSMEKIIQRGDEYRYYFTVNLAIHKIVQFFACENGMSFSLYLPRMAKKFISQKDWGILQYKVGSDMKTHYKKFLERTKCLVK